MLRPRNEWTHDHCPRCGLPDEHTDHVLVQMPLLSPQVMARAQYIPDPRYLHSRPPYGGLPDLRPLRPHLSPLLRAALQAQDQLGWHNSMLDGCFLAIEWELYQAPQYQSTMLGSRHSDP